MESYDEIINNNVINMNNYINDKQKYPDEVIYTEGSYKLVVRRIDTGTYCGYIILPQFHRYDGVDCDDIHVDVHGGLTYSRRENGYWVIGFDTMHYNDYIPSYNSNQNYYYWTHDDVLNELKKLVSQL
jgi:hypothetical protein